MDVMGDDRPRQPGQGRARLLRVSAVLLFTGLVTAVGASGGPPGRTAVTEPSDDTPATAGVVRPTGGSVLALPEGASPESSTTVGAAGTTVPSGRAGTSSSPSSGEATLGAPSATPTPPVTAFVPWEPAALYVSPESAASQQAVTWQTTNPAGAAIMARVARVPQARWFVNQSNAAIQGAVDAFVSAAAKAAATPVLVAYHIPNRDCGSHSAGGASSAADYAVWLANFAAGIGNRPAVVIVEPDALSQLTTCLPTAGQEERLAMLKGAIDTLKQRPAAHVYLDAGTIYSRNASTIASWLVRAGVAAADGFSLNVANFHATELNVAYGRKVSSMAGGKHFVIDTSRNGNGATADHQWCNPPGRALGATPEIRPATSPLVDALLWIKTPGQSDGACNGGPTPGTWWPEYLQGLAQAAGW
jgi:endoglucanase